MILQRLLFKETSATLLTGERHLVELRVFLQFSFQRKTGSTVLTGEPVHCLRLFLFNPSSLRPTGFDLVLLGAVVSVNWK